MTAIVCQNHIEDDISDTDSTHLRFPSLYHSIILTTTYKYTLYSQTFSALTCIIYDLYILKDSLAL